jgi:hypothetical protein
MKKKPNGTFILITMTRNNTPSSISSMMPRSS